MKFRWERGLFTGEPTNPGEGVPNTPGGGGTPPADTPQTPAPQAGPESWSKDPVLGRFKTVDALAGSYKELHKMSSGMIRVPPEDAKPEEVREIMGKLGLPKEAKEYNAVLPVLPEGVDYPDGFLDELREEAHALGLTKRQFSQYVQGEAQAWLEGTKGAVKQVREWNNEIKEEWGGAHERNLAIAKRALSHIDKDGKLAAILNETGLGNHPVLQRAFFDMGLRLQEDGLIVGEFKGIHDPAQAKSKIAELRKEKAYLDGSHPDHNRLVAEVENLYKLAYPGIHEPKSL